MHAGRPVRRCCRCNAALSIEPSAGRGYQAMPLTAATWKAMKSAWESWEPWTATGWQQPDVIKDILACAAREFTRYTPTERSPRDFIDLVNPAITVVIATTGLASQHPALKPLAQSLHPPRPLSDEALLRSRDPPGEDDLDPDRTPRAAAMARSEQRCTPLAPARP